MEWVCDKDYSKIKLMEQDTMLTYWFLLNKKIAEAKKAAATNKRGKTMNRARTNRN